MDDLAHARALCDQLGGTFCLTYLKDVGAAEALRRLGGCPDTVRERSAGELAEQRQSFDAGFPELAVALEIGAWSVVIEPGGFLGAGHPLLEAASRGIAAVSVSRNDSASAHFGYVVDGTTVTGFDPGYPAVETIWGSEPGMLRHLMDALGLRPQSDESENTWQDAEARAIVLAQRITGARIPAQPLLTPRVSAQLEPWFVTPAASSDLLRADRRAPFAAELVAAAEAADPGLRRTVAVAEVRRQAAVLGVAESPGLAETLAAGTPVAVDSPLGEQVRGWLATGRRASRTGDPRYRHRMTDEKPRHPTTDEEHPTTGEEHRTTDEVHRMTDEERRHAAGLGWFLGALRGVLDADTRVALLAALKPYTSGLAGLADDQARAAVLGALRDQAR